MDYKEAMEYVDECGQFGMVLGLDTMKELLRQLGNPEKNQKVLHIAGTNGKGSVGTFLTSILAAAGFKVGRYVSPVILEYCERIQFQKGKENQYIKQNTVAELLTKIRKCICAMRDQGFPHPTLFEIETAMAFLAFAEEKCDFVVLEVGLGGRLDATNVVENVEVSILTAIGMDHMKMLGNTIEKIAWEKCGIIKNEVPVITYVQEVSVQRVILQQCQEKGTELFCCDFTQLQIQSQSMEGTIFSYKEFSDIEISILGENQPKNAALALEVIQHLRKIGYLISEQAVKEGMKLAKWPGRFQVVSAEPLIVVDGAHNQPAAYSLIKSLDLYFPKQKWNFIVGIFADKEYEKILEITAPYAKKIVTITPPGARGLPAEQLSRIAKKHCQIVECGKDIRSVLERVSTCREEKFLVFGSLSFLGTVIEYFNANN
ncbi:bifunctional folylpolyglutamate synthase/dihydrofolate synthase [Anaeromicropila populeti]|uniref:tetrahydrofolate synthase n=1 Tax=Anaeromicropila populeti TaxID=37658 RepID=A0A1I6KS02_9FIRM|nr:folylpolyglutamate synthase/dihydrofolate synthase family protein [Anaeromicropila populeti]SFR94009.1 dihydrofolate synthase / folylpolyglutamate synthase [Anaeromicropila populeti]